MTMGSVITSLRAFVTFKHVILISCLVKIQMVYGFIHQVKLSRGCGLSFSAEADEGDLQRFYFDMSVDGDSIGNLVFVLPKSRTLFPKHTENILKLVEGSSTGLDPRLSFKNCQFQYSPQFIEGFPQYRWAHHLPGNGRNAIGRAEDRIVDTESLQANTFRVYGGIYYGLEFSSIPEDNCGILTIPMTGPGRGSTGLSIVRVSDSPSEWKERLLLNSAVLGWLEPESASTLRGFQQTRGPPIVTSSGFL